MQLQVYEMAMATELQQIRPFPQTGWLSLWVILGFLFWFGFYIGALIMHALIG